MTFVFPFEEEFCQTVRTVYYVNNDSQDSGGSSTTTSEACPHCKERNIFKVFDEPQSSYEESGWHVQVYDCKCPNCRKEFNLEIEHEIE